MKILVLSNVPGSVDRIVDILHTHHNVIAKEANIAESTIASTAAEQLAKKAYDQVIVVARDPIQAGMLLNKKEKVDAAVCHTPEDVKLAKSNGANVIIIRDINSAAAHEIIATAASVSLRGLKIPQFRMPEVHQSQLEREEPAAKRRGIMGSKNAKAEQKEGPPRRAADPNSVVGKIKDYLGIL